MLPRYTVLRNGLAMSGGTVAFIVAQVVFGKAVSQALDQVISPNFSNNTSGSDQRRAAVSLNQGVLGEG